MKKWQHNLKTEQAILPAAAAVQTELDRNLLFLKIPKNAGSSFVQSFPDIPFKRHSEAFPLPGHVNIAIIRNPFTRLQSIFAHLKDRTHNPAQLKCNDLLEFKSLHELALAWLDQANDYHIKARHLFDWQTSVDLKSYNTYAGCSETRCIHWAPQSFFVNDNRPKVEYLIKFESMESDIRKLNRIGVLEKGELLKRNISPAKYKAAAQLTPECCQLVEAVYKEDFRLWEKAGI